MPINDNRKKKIEDAYSEHLKTIPESEQEMARDFYQAVIKRFSSEPLKNKISFIIAGHLVPTLPFYLEALQKVGDVKMIIAKGSTPDESIKQWVDDAGFRVFMSGEKSDKVRETLSKPDGFQSLIDEALGEDTESKLIFIDIGGYFAPGLKFSDALKEKDRILGFVEDTENGLQDYIKIAPFAKPVISVARSEIKDAEDFNVGKAITEATDHILKMAHYTHIAEDKTVLVIGYGKVGSAAAISASQKTRGPVLVCEKEPVRKLKASAHSFKVVTLEEGLRQADIVISCTGQHALQAEHVKLLRNNCCIASCTSSDKEFSPNFLQELQKEKADDKGKSTEHNKESLVDSYKCVNHTIHLLNKGNSVNFVQKAVHGYFIHGVLASLLVSALEIAYTPDPGLEAKLYDFNDLAEGKGEGEGKKARKYQAIISDLLMRRKLNREPIISNHSMRAKRYIQRNDDVKRLKKAFVEHDAVLLTGEAKAGKTQVMELFVDLYKSLYDVVWRFDAARSMTSQFEVLEQQLQALLPKDQRAQPEKRNAQTASPHKTVLHSPDSIRSIKMHDDIISRFGETVRKLPDIQLLLIFENAGSYSAEVLNTLLDSKKLDSQKILKQSNVLITCGDKQDLFRARYEIKLSPYDRKDLFAYLLNDPTLNPTAKDFEDMDTRMQGDSEAQKVAMLNMAATFIQHSSSKDSDYSTSKMLGDWTASGNPKEEKEAFLRLMESALSPSAKEVLYFFHCLQLEKSRYLITIDRLLHIGYRLFNENASKLQSYINELMEHSMLEERDGFLLPIYPGQWPMEQPSMEQTPVKQVPIKQTPIETTSAAIKAIVKTFLSVKSGERVYKECIDIVEELEDLKTSTYTNWIAQNPCYAFKMYKKLTVYYIAQRDAESTPNSPSIPHFVLDETERGSTAAEEVPQGSQDTLKKENIPEQQSDGITLAQATEQESPSLKKIKDYSKRAFEIGEKHSMTESMAKLHEALHTVAGLDGYLAKAIKLYEELEWKKFIAAIQKSELCSESPMKKKLVSSTTFSRSKRSLAAVEHDGQGLSKAQRVADSTPSGSTPSTPLG